MEKKKRLFLLMLVATFIVPLFFIPTQAGALESGLYIADWGTGFVSHMDLEGNVTRFFPKEGDPTLNGPVQLKQDPNGNLTLSVKNEGAIYRVTPQGEGNIIVTGLNLPHGMAYDEYGNLYVAEQGTGSIWRFPAGGGSGTVLVAGLVGRLEDLQFDDVWNLYVTVYEDNGRLLRMTRDALQGVPPVTCELIYDGLDSPVGLDFYDGTLYVADRDNFRIVEVDVQSLASSVYYYPIQFEAQTPYGPYLTGPIDIAFDEEDSVYISLYNVIDKLDVDGNLTTVAAGFSFAEGIIYVPPILIPTITTISPSSAFVSGPTFTLTVTGTNFVPGAVVLWNNSDRPTRYVSPTELRATISASDIAALGTARITVINPTPERSQSNPMTFSIVNPVPVLTGLNPGAVTVKGPSFTLTVYGWGFVLGSTVRWNGASRTTTFVSNTELRATISSTDIVSAGTVNIAVLNPSPGGGLSNVLTLSIRNPVPSLTGLTPSSATAGGPGLTLVVNGTSFVSGSVVRWNGADRVTTFVSSTQVSATISGTDIAVPGTATITVFTPPPGGGLSNSLPFSIVSTVPSVTSLSPSSASAGGADFTLTVTGTNFIQGSVVRWNGSDRPTAFVSNTQVQASISADDIADPGIMNVSVFNPFPGGGSSNALPFRIKIATRVEVSVDSVFVSSGTQYVKLKARVIDTLTGQPIYGIGYRYIYTYFYLDRRYIGMSRVNGVQGGAYAGYSVISYKIKSGTHPAKVVFNENEKYGGSEAQISFSVP